MASFFNVGALGGNPFSTPVGQRIEQATDSSLASENWALNMEICDFINESSDTARDAMKAIRKRLTQNAGKNHQVIMYTLIVLETCVKNCGKAFHVLVASKEFIQELVKLIGPKNDPPPVVQDKVLSLIQIWADAFKNQPDLNGVTQMYMELRNKGIEFPPTDLDAVAPIYTPQRSVPETQPPVMAHPKISPHHVLPVAITHPTGPVTLTPEQTAKIQSELETVGINMSILTDMLNELKPGQEQPEDYVLLNELVATCKEMQGRIVDLIGRINDDEITAELLRLNDELNNLFLRHQRYEKSRSCSTTTTSPSTILGAAIGVPPASSAIAISGAGINAGAAAAATVAASPSVQPKLIDFVEKNEILSEKFNKFAITPPSVQPQKDADEFDMLAQSRSDGNTKSDLLKDLPSVDAITGSVGSPFKRNDGDPPLVVSKLPAKDSDFDEMEAWLSNSKDPDGIEETLTSTEFDKFLEERAAAAESLPSIINTATTSNTNQNQRKLANQKPAEDEDLLKL